MKIRAIAVPATLATVYPASAGQRLIFEILNIFDVQCPRPLGRVDEFDQAKAGGEADD
jgi:hypothetical protein